jgi:hypothetical protein
MNVAPPSITAEETLMFGHRDRAKRAVAELNAAAQAPALFKPEWTERAQADLEAARRGVELASL